MRGGTREEGWVHGEGKKRQRTDQACWRHTAAHQNSMGAAPLMTPPTQGGQSDGSGLRGPPGERSTGGPSSPPPRAASRPRPNAHAGGVCADDTSGARVGNRGPPPEGEQGGRSATPPPNPQLACKPRGRRPTPPRGRGDGPPSPRPREEPEHGPRPRPSRRLPQKPRGTSEPAPTRQDPAQIAPREGGRGRTKAVWGPRPP